MRFGSAPVMVNGSTSASFVTPGVNVSQAWAFSFQANYRAFAAGTTGHVKIQVSNDNITPILSGSGSASAQVTNWADLGVAASTSATIGSTAITSTFLNAQNVSANWARLSFVLGSGTGEGAMSVNYFGKDA